MTNLTPFGALFISLLIFAFGDFVGVVTKAKVSTMFVIMATFLVLFMTHAIPADICTTANLTYVTSIGLQFLLVDMGSSVGLTELKKEWRTVATATIALLLAVVGCAIAIPVIGREAALVSMPVIAGGVGLTGTGNGGMAGLAGVAGGDIAGSILAQCREADLYENGTDVSGFLSADPRIVPGAQPIPRITYEELRELSYMGASVLHEEAVFPVRDAGIPLVIKNTNAPEDPGTIISETAKEGDTEPIITGIAGKRDFLAINVSRDRTKSRIGFMRRALSVFERYGVSVEHMPTGVDQFAAVVQAADVKDSLYSLISDIQEEVEPLEIEVVEDLALIATVGRNLSGRAGISGHLFGKLGEAGVSVRMITQGCDEINIIIGVEERDFDLAIKTIYEAFSDEGGIVKTAELEPAPRAF